MIGMNELEKKHKNPHGSITVFLTLTLLLILSLLMTILEGARVSVAKVFAERALITSMDSLLAEFYLPLFDEYHVFALDLGNGGYGANEEKLTSKMNNYMDYTFNPNNNIIYSGESTELYSIQASDITIKNWISLMDQEGEIFTREAAEYMKYKEVGKLAETLLDKMSLLEEPRKVAIIYEEKLKVEEELVEVDESILKLMNYLDGVVTSKKGLKVNRDGSLRISPYFVKKFCLSPISRERVGINNEQVFRALKNEYIDPINWFNEMNYNFRRIEQTKRSISSISSEYNNTRGEITKEEYLLRDYQAIEEKTSDDKEIIKGTKAKIKELERKNQNLSGDMITYEDNIRGYKEELLINKNLVFDWTVAISPSITLAIETIDQILERLDKVQPSISNYGDLLKKEKNNLSIELLEGLEEGYKDLEKYSLHNKEGYDFIKMKEVLKHDQAVLQSVQIHLTEGEKSLQEGAYDKAADSINLSKKSMAEYKLDGLELDYSSLVINKESEKDAIGSISSLVKGGIMGLVTDSEQVSTCEIATGTLPSVIEALSIDEETFDFAKLFGSNLSSVFANFTSSNIVDELMESILFQAYIQEHFYSFPLEGEVTSSRKPTALSYELEYLISGKYKDKENLSSVISKIILMRTILNFTSLLGNKAKMAEAKAIAIALVGFTGLAILVSITQSILMVALSFAEALVDTSALLLAKEVPILKKNIELEYKDIFLLNNLYIGEKAKKYPDKPKEIALSYNDYLRIFLISARKKDLSFRGMDLIQENIKIRYEDTFLIQNCLYEFQVESKFLIKPRFANISYVRDIINSSNEAFNYKTEYIYSY